MLDFTRAELGISQLSERFIYIFSPIMNWTPPLRKKANGSRSVWENNSSSFGANLSKFGVKTFSKAENSNHLIAHREAGAAPAGVVCLLLLYYSQA